ncbi:hypothetical protein [Pseudomonas sp. UMAB-40]|uniref:hypothetical protein n=1 Tax=Pseudomonas sp. UMAB-40 TaxID=1365407 RepID=UPI001C59AB37|nr:hypothetical protein [Pseudomonas sp. UMAB-40]
MSQFPTNEHGVPLYPKGHAGRLLVTMAAIDALDTPTAASVAALTGLSKGNIDTYVSALNREFGVRIEKEGPVYSIQSWGDILKKTGVKKVLTGSV